MEKGMCMLFLVTLLHISTDRPRSGRQVRSLCFTIGTCYLTANISHSRPNQQQAIASGTPSIDVDNLFLNLFLQKPG